MAEVTIRCLACRERFTVEPNAEKAKCSNCGQEWHITWISAEQAKIKGPAK